MECVYICECVCGCVHAVGCGSESQGTQQHQKKTHLNGLKKSKEKKHASPSYLVLKFDELFRVHFLNNLLLQVVEGHSVSQGKVCAP